MENNFENSNTGNWNNPNQNFNKQDLPNAMGAFVLGIISVCTSVLLCCCYGYIIGLITSIIGLVLGGGAIKAYKQNPERYHEVGFRRAKNGKLLSWIGLAVSLAIILLVVLVVVLKATGNLPDELEKYERYNRNF